LEIANLPKRLGTLATNIVIRGEEHATAITEEIVMTEATATETVMDIILATTQVLFPVDVKHLFIIATIPVVSQHAFSFPERILSLVLNDDRLLSMRRTILLQWKNILSILLFKSSKK